MWRTVGTWIERCDPEIADVILDASLAVLLAAVVTDTIQFICGLV